MPYIITTRRETPGIIARDTMPPLPVATLDEALQAAQDVIDNGPPIESKAEWAALCDAVAELPGSGGTIGPLPDGTVIEVARVDWDAIAPPHV